MQDATPSREANPVEGDGPQKYSDMDDTLVEKTNHVDQHTIIDESFSLQWKERIVFSALMVSAFFTSLEATAVGPPLPVCLPNIIHFRKIVAS